MPIKFRTTVQLQPKEVDANFETTILNKLKQNLESVCSKHGYIKKNTLKIVKRSAGYFKEHHFNGNIAFDINCIAEICNPAQNSIITCQVKAKNELGLLAQGMFENEAILEVIVPKKSFGMQSEVNIDTINVGDEIKVQVCGKEFMLYDRKISIIGKAIKDKDNNIVVHNEDIEEEDVEPVDPIEFVDEIEPEEIGLLDTELEDDETDNNSIKKLNIVENNDNEITDDDEEDDEEDEEEDEDDEFEEDFAEEELEDIFQIDDDE